MPPRFRIFTFISSLGLASTSLILQPEEAGTALRLKPTEARTRGVHKCDARSHDARVIRPGYISVFARVQCLQYISGGIARALWEHGCALCVLRECGQSEKLPLKTPFSNSLEPYGLPRTVGSFRRGLEQGVCREFVGSLKIIATKTP